MSDISERIDKTWLLTTCVMVCVISEGNGERVKDDAEIFFAGPRAQITRDEEKGSKWIRFSNRTCQVANICTSR